MPAFGVAGGQAAVLLEPVEAAFDDVAALYRARSKPQGRPPAEPRRRRLACWSSFSGIVWLIRRRRSSARIALLLYALSAIM